MSHLIDRLFAAGSVLARDSARLRSHLGVLAPENWSLEAIETLLPALFAAAPAHRNAIEENTLPSWLWKRRAVGKETKPETSIMEIADRIAGAAAYRGWKSSLFQSEIEASVFHDELREILLTRRLILAPEDCARLGLGWAYGADAAEKSVRAVDSSESANLILQNETIDAILGVSTTDSTPAARTKWLRFLETSQRKNKVSIAFADTIAEWGTPAVTEGAPRAMLNLTAFLQEDGSLDLAGLEQTAKIAVLLMELFYDRMGNPDDLARPLKLGFCNLSGLLLSLGLAYDSRQARGTAAAIAALITGAASAASAELAGRLGPCKAFAPQREALLRKLENQARAAFGEKNDYDRLSVPPQPLALESGVNLVLLSTARHIFEKALDLTRASGLRHLLVTGLFSDPSFASLAEAYSQGVAPESALSCSFARDENESFERIINPSLIAGLMRLGYDRADIEAATRRITGYRTLVAAPGISQTSLREKGFDDASLARIESYLSQIDTLQTAFTPWVLGTDFCRETLKVPAKDIKNPAFDLLHYLGFSTKEIALANAFCCGHRSLKGLAEIAEKDAPVFATREDIAPEALIKMAAAVQSFVSGDVGVTIAVPAAITAQVRGELILMAWKRGLRSLTLLTEGTPALLTRKAETVSLIKRKTKSVHSAARKKATIPAKSPRTSRERSSTIALKPRGGKTGLREKRS